MTGQARHTKKVARRAPCDLIEKTNLRGRSCRVHYRTLTHARKGAGR
jgi:hypothetical protein